MVLLISTTHQPATDLGFLLHKNPARVHEFTLNAGRATVAYPEATAERTTVALVVEIDPVGLVRGKNEAQGSLAQYVNDRPYTANSFLSVAIVEAFGTAMAGRSKERPELAESAIPLEIRLPVVPCRAGEAKLRALFEPLGFSVEAKPLPLDALFPEWGDSRYFDLTLRGEVRLRDALRQLYLLLPALDSHKHYFMDQQEVAKVVQKGEGWLENHPERDWILRASLGRKPSMVREALVQLSNAEEGLETEEKLDETEEKPTPTLHRQRHDRIVDWIRKAAPSSVLDLGCGEGKLLRLLMPIKGLQRIVGMDVSYYDLEKARRLLRLDDAAPAMASRIELIHGSLMYRDDRLRGFEVCTVVEVIEHLDPPRLGAFEKVVFGHAQPRTVLLTTPNREYNSVYGLEDLRHTDHRFEWTRAEFESWANRVASEHGYAVSFEGIGEEHPEFGCSSQMGVFQRCN